MSDLLASANQSGGHRQLEKGQRTEDRGQESRKILFSPLLRRPPSVLCPSPTPVLLFEFVSKWYGPVIGVNQVTLELRPGITGLVGHNGSRQEHAAAPGRGQLRPDIGRVCSQRP